MQDQKTGALNKRLAFAAKARVIVFVFLIPIAVLGGVAIKGYLDSSDFTLRERGGVQLLQSLATLNQQLVLRHDADRGLNG